MSSWRHIFVTAGKAEVLQFCALTESEKQSTQTFNTLTVMWNNAMLVTLRQTIKNEQIDFDAVKMLPYICGQVEFPKVWEVHEDIVQYVSQLNSDSLSTLGKLWLDRDHVLATYCTDELIHEMLVDLQRAAVEAKRRDVSVFLCVD